MLEHGDIQFFFRPMVQPADAEETALGVQAMVGLDSVVARTPCGVRLGQEPAQREGDVLAAPQGLGSNTVLGGPTARSRGPGIEVGRSRVGRPGAVG